MGGVVGGLLRFGCRLTLLSGLILSACGLTGDGGHGASEWVDVEFFVDNDSDVERTQTVLASVPFAESQIKDLHQASVENVGTSWRVLQRWRDGSIKIAQAQFLDTLAPKSRKTYKIVKLPSRDGGFEHHPWVRRATGKLLFMPEVVDDDGVSYFGIIQDEGEVLQSTYHVKTTFWRLYLRNGNPSAGIGRDFLTARLYLTEYRNMPFVSVGMTIGNDYRGADDPKGDPDPNLYPLGAVSLQDVYVHTMGGWNKLRQRDKHGVAPIVYDPRNGMEIYRLLQDTHLDDGQTKYWKFLVYVEDFGAPQKERDAWRRTWQEEVAHPLRPLATRRTWQETEALGINGGPATGPTDSYDRAEVDYYRWNSKQHFGPFGEWGDVKYTHTTGTPRNTPVSRPLARAIQGENPHLLAQLEGMAWIQAARQYHLWGLEVDDQMDIYLWFGLWFGIINSTKLSEETLGRFKLIGDNGANDPYKRWRRNVPSGGKGHGWNGFDMAHATADLVFDYYTVTGDFWARDELEMIGQYARGIMRFQKYNAAWPQSPRAEGWSMQVLVQAYLATGNEDFKQHGLRRVRERIEPFRKKDHPTRAMSFTCCRTETNYPQGTSFFNPYMHAAVIYGYLGAHRFFGSDLALQIAEDAAFTADLSHVENWTDPVTKKFYRFETRFYVPAILNGTYRGRRYFNEIVPIDFFDNDPEIGSHVNRHGTTVFFLSAMYLLADRTRNQSVRARALRFGDGLLGTDNPDPADFYISKWASIVPDHMLPANR